MQTFVKFAQINDNFKNKREKYYRKGENYICAVYMESSVGRGEVFGGMELVQYSRNPLLWLKIRATSDNASHFPMWSTSIFDRDNG